MELKIEPTFGLKGAPKIIYDELRRMLRNGLAPSTYKLAHRTFYSQQTVMRALSELEDYGLVQIEATRRGCPSKYSLTEDL